MAKWLRLAFVSAAFLLVLPVIVLCWARVVKPAEGFCLEHGAAGMGDAPTPEEAASSFFVSPELAYRVRWYSDEARRDRFSWPVCLRSRRGEHRMTAYAYDRNLTRLGEPNLSSLHTRAPSARVLRLVSAPSFDRGAIALRLEVTPSGAGVIYAAWLVDDERPPELNADPDAYTAWWEAPLPRAAARADISAADVAALMALSEAAIAEARASWNWATLDGNWVAIEHIDNGRREVRHALLTGETADLFCRMAALARAPGGCVAPSGE